MLTNEFVLYVSGHWSLGERTQQTEADFTIDVIVIAQFKHCLTLVHCHSMAKLKPHLLGTS